MSNVLVFENTSLKNSGKHAIMRPDATGYYEVSLGAYGVFNSAGAYYPSDKVRNLFTSSSELMERVKSGRLYGEWGHPKMSPGMSTRDYLVKLLIMHEEQVSHHIKRVELRENFKNVDGTNCLGVVGWIKPYGPQRHCVEDAIDNPEQNLCFSMRAISMDSRDSLGRITKTPVKIVTWDGVAEPGIDLADKYNNPAVETRYVGDAEFVVTATHQFTQTDIVRAVSNAQRLPVGVESAVAALSDLAGAMGLPSLDAPVGVRSVARDTKHINRMYSWTK